MLDTPFRRHLRATRTFGCLFYLLLGGGMAFVVFVGSVIGDCEAGPGCHDHNASRIGFSIIALLISLGLGMCAWVLRASLRTIAALTMPTPAINAVLLVFALPLVGISFSSAIEFLLSVTARGIR